MGENQTDQVLYMELMWLMSIGVWTYCISQCKLSQYTLKLNKHWILDVVQNGAKKLSAV